MSTLYLQKHGAGDGNRTHAISLEGWSSTIELHPHTTLIRWWRGEDSNLRRHSRQIYSLIPLAAREPLLHWVIYLLYLYNKISQTIYDIFYYFILNLFITAGIPFNIILGIASLDRSKTNFKSPHSFCEGSDKTYSATDLSATGRPIPILNL